jgi:hypothetical protein
MALSRCIMATPSNCVQMSARDRPEAVEVHASTLMSGRGGSHELPLSGHDPPGGDGVAAGDDVLQVSQCRGRSLEARDLLLEAYQPLAGRWIVLDQAWSRASRSSPVARAKRVLKRLMISMLPDKDSPSLPSVLKVSEP